MLIPKIRITPAWMLFVLLAASAIYWPGLSGDYLFDDTANILENDRFKFDALTPEALWLVVTSGDAGPLKRPISMISFALNVATTGFDPFYLKITNLAVHLINVGLVFVLCSLLLRSPGLGMATRNRQSQMVVALAASAIWAFHPLNLTSVLYIVQRMTSLAAVFCLLAIIFYCVGRLRMIDGRPRAWRFILAGTAIPGGVALLCKENSVLLPVFLLAVEAVCFRFGGADPRDRRAIAWFHITIFSAIAAVLVAILLWRAEMLIGSYVARDFTLEQRLLTQPRVIFLYLRLFLLPSNEALALYHDDLQTSTSFTAPPETLAAMIGIACLAAVVVPAMRRAPMLALSILWFLGGHLLESTFLPLEMVHEHRNYLPLVVPSLALAYYAIEFPSHKVRRISQIALGVFMALLMALTFHRAMQWGSMKDQAIYEVQHKPGSERAHVQMGRVMTLLYHAEHNPAYLDEGLAQFAAAAKLSKIGIGGEVGFIRLSFLGKRPPAPEFYQSVIDKISSGPQSPATTVVLQSLSECNLYRICDVPDDVMMTIFNAYLNNPQALASAKSLLTMVAAQYLFDKLGDGASAILALENAVRREPTFLNGARNLVRLYRLSGQFDKAWSSLSEVRKMDQMNSMKPELDGEETALRLAQAKANANPGIANGIAEQEKR